MDTIDNNPQEPSDEKHEDDLYLFEKVSKPTTSKLAEDEVEAEVESTAEDFDDYSTAMETSPTEEDVYESMKVKLKWSRVFIVGLIIGLFIIAVTLLIIWLVSMNGQMHRWWFLPWIYFVICGLMLIFGGCVGTVKQSFTIDAIRNRMAKGEKITGADTKIAIGSAYTYIFAGTVVGIASLIAWLIV